MNTLESIKKDCSESGWDGYTAEPINDVVLENAKLVQPFIPDDFELFPCGDGSVQWENTESEDDVFEVIEIYDDELIVLIPTYTNYKTWKKTEESVDNTALKLANELCKDILDKINQ